MREQLRDCDTLVCVDGGLRHLDALELQPEMIIGDMDSISKERFKQLESSVEFIRFASEKNETDLELALAWACKQRFDEVLLLGLSGGRVDHSLANLHLMAAVAWPFKLSAWVDGQHLHLLQGESSIDLAKLTGATLSLIPLGGDADGITTLGLKYPLDKESLKLGSPRGISNIVELTDAAVQLESGQLLVVITPDDYCNV